MNCHTRTPPSPPRLFFRFHGPTFALPRCTPPADSIDKKKTRVIRTQACSIRGKVGGKVPHSCVAMVVRWQGTDEDGLLSRSDQQSSHGGGVPGAPRQRVSPAVAADRSNARWSPATSPVGAHLDMHATSAARMRLSCPPPSRGPLIVLLDRGATASSPGACPDRPRLTPRPGILLRGVSSHRGPTNNLAAVG